MPELRIEATINGRKIARGAAPHQRLLDFLREDMHLTGTKDGCGAGECGACSVFVDGVLMKSCLMPIGKAQGSQIDTVEGLAQKGELSLLQKAFHKTGASQCGYCIPGMVMAATSALRINRRAGARCAERAASGDGASRRRAGRRQIHRRQCAKARRAEQGVRRVEICRRHDDAGHAAHAGAALAARACGN